MSLLSYDNHLHKRWSKADLKVFFADLLKRNDDHFGQIYKLSLNDSKMKNASTFIGFMRMSNVKFHQTVINRYNGTMFRNRMLNFFWSRIAPSNSDIKLLEKEAELDKRKKEPIAKKTESETKWAKRE